MTRPLLVAMAVATAACGKPGGPPSCGVAALAGPTLLLNEFGTPGKTLSQAPAGLPEHLVVRMVAGGALTAIVGRTDTTVVVGVEGSVPETIKPSFGVLLVDPAGTARGVMLFEGAPIQRAPQIGIVNVGVKVIPLLGIEADPARFEEPRCPLFPDSLLR